MRLILGNVTLMQYVKVTQEHVDYDEKYRLFYVESPSIVPAPGQYFEIEIDNHKQYCVAAHVKADELGFLIRRSKSQIDQHIVLDKEIKISNPQGGYSLTNIEGRRVTALAGGSGVAAMIDVLNAAAWVARDVTLLYSESDGTYAEVLLRHLAPSIAVYRYKTEGCMSMSSDIPILGMISQLSNVQPIVFLDKPVVYACGPKNYVERLRLALTPHPVADDDFRLNF